MILKSVISEFIFGFRIECSSGVRGRHSRYTFPFRRNLVLISKFLLLLGTLLIYAQTSPQSSLMW